MNLPEIPYEFYGAHVTDISIGPRRELQLSLELWPQANGQLYEFFHRGDGINITVRFGGLYNFEEVKVFWEKWQSSMVQPGLHYLRYSQIQNSKPGSLFIEAEFDSTGDYVMFHCQHFTVTRL